MESEPRENAFADGTEQADVPRVGRGGRPRDASVEDKVLPLVRTMLVEVGWNDLSLRAVAAQAGVGRATLDRRWRSKAELVLDALLSRLPSSDDLVGLSRAEWTAAVIEVTRDLMRKPEFRAALPGMLGMFDQDPDLRRAVWDRFAAPAMTTLAGPDTADGSDRLDATAIMVIAAGAALFIGTVPPDANFGAVERRIDELLHRMGESPG